MKQSLKLVSLIAALLLVMGSAVAQNGGTVLTGGDLTRVVPTSFYFQGLSAPTQMRNAAAARFGKDRYVISGLVDTSGYSADVRAKYVGFLITDSPITLNGESLQPGAYGFGFATEGKLTVMDLSGKDLMSVSITNDKDLKRPRPLMMTADSGVSCVPTTLIFPAVTWESGLVARIVRSRFTSPVILMRFASSACDNTLAAYIDGS